MKRLIPLSLALTSLAWLPQAAAQGTPAISTNLTVTIDGDQVDNTSQNVFIGKADCTEKTEVVFEVGNFPVEVPVLELWVSRGTGNNCSTPVNRQNSENMASVCRRVASTTNIQATDRKTISVTGLELFSDDGEECVAVTSQPFNAYFVPLESPTLDGTGMAPDILTGAEPLKATFTLYTEDPDAPSDVKGSSGESRLAVSWDQPDTYDEFTSYRVYYDVGQGGEPCGSGLLVAGEKLSATARESDNLKSEKTDRENGSLTGLDGLVEVGQVVAAAVVTVDAGGNTSKLSEVVCIERVRVDGFYDRSGGKGLEKCSMQAPGRASLIGLGSLSLLAFALVARRRRAT